MNYVRRRHHAVRHALVTLRNYWTHAGP